MDAILQGGVAEHRAQRAPRFRRHARRAAGRARVGPAPDSEDPERPFPGRGGPARVRAGPRLPEAWRGPSSWTRPVGASDTRAAGACCSHLCAGRARPRPFGPGPSPSDRASPSRPRPSRPFPGGGGVMAPPKYPARPPRGFGPPPARARARSRAGGPLAEERGSGSSGRPRLR
jgi:hypothetical protein